MVPTVTEPWSSTAVVGSPRESRFVHHVGHFPGFKEGKRLANEARASGQSQVLETPAGAQAPTEALTTNAASSSQGIVFNGPSESDTNVIPPDPVLAAGPNNVVVLINSIMAIYDKSGNQQGGFQNLATFFSSLGIAGQVFDPRIMFDQTDKRFILTAAEVDETSFTNGNVFIAVSQTSDPTGVWNKFAVNFEGTSPLNGANTFPDFPTLGLSSTAIYVSTGQFELNASCAQNDSCSFSDTWIKVIGLPELLSGNPTLNITTFKNVTGASGGQAFAIQPALTYGTPADEFLVAASFSANPGTTLNLFAINTSGTPVLSAAVLSVPSFSLPPDATQPSGLPVATNDFRLLNTVWSNGSLWCGQNVMGLNSNAVVRWYQITAASLSSISLMQSGDISGNSDAYFPAIAVTSAGDAEVVFTTSSVFEYASAGFAGRSASDALNTMRTFVIYRQGASIYSEPSTLRWGDYSGASLDTDGSTIWVIAEYASSPNPHFGTAVAELTAPPALVLSSTRIDFGNQAVGQASTPITLTLTNSSGSSIMVAPIVIGGTNASDFVLTTDQCSNAALAAGGSCTVAITFTPAATGGRTALMTIAAGPGSSVVAVQLVGTGSPLSGSLLLQPSSLTFPDTPARGASPPQSLTLKNVSSGPIVIDYINAGSGQGGFAQTNNCGASLAAGASCIITVTFRPALGEPYSGEVDVVSGTASVASFLSGKGVLAPAVTPCPIAVSFPNQLVGTPSAPIIVAVSNTGSSQLIVTAITVNGDFTQTNSCPTTLIARTACNIDVTFTPTVTGTRTGTLTIADSAAGSPHKVSLTGTGVASAGSITVPAPLLLAGRLFDREAATGSMPARGSEQAKPVRAGQAYGRLPLSFEANEGQMDSGIRFLSRGKGYTLLLTSREAVLAVTRIQGSRLRGQESKASGAGRAVVGRAWGRVAENRQRTTDFLRMSLVGANRSPKVEGLDELPGSTNYLIGNDPTKWRTHIASYARVRYADIYPGIDLIYYGNQDELEYDFVVAPGADPNQVAIRIETDRGIRRAGTPTPRHSDLRVDQHGDVVVRTPTGEARLHRPVVYQIPPAAGGSTETLPRRSTARWAKGRWFVKGEYVLNRQGQVSFRIPAYDQTKPLVIDPQFSYSTFLGGSGRDTGYGIAVDTAGSAYITGSTASPDFPTANALQPTINQVGLATADVFVTKLSPDGSSFVYSTFLGGTQADIGYAIAVDGAGSAYVTGSTGSSDFPVTKGAFQSVFGGSGDAFLAKLGPNGSSLVYSTYLGGIGQDEAHGIALDAAGNAYVTGATTSPDLKATSGALQTVLAPVNTSCAALTVCGHGFVAELNSAGSALGYLTYLEGSGVDSPQGIAVDSSGNAYVTGITTSNDFPTTVGAYQTGYSATPTSAFITKLNPQGTALVYSSYLGGNGNPVTSSSIGDEAWAIAVDASGSAYVTGETSSVDFPTVNAAQSGLDAGVATLFPNSLDPTNSDAFVAKLHPDGCALRYSTYVGGLGGDVGLAIAIDSSGHAFVAGLTNSYDFPTANAVQASYVSHVLSSSEPFVIELDPTGSKFLYSTYLDGSTTDLYAGSIPYDNDRAFAIAVDSQGNAYVIGATAAADFPTANAARPNYGGQQDAFVTQLNSTNVPSLIIDPPRLIFGTQVIGTTSAAQSLTLTNQSASSVTISGITLNAPDFRETGNCGATLAAQATCMITVTFSPTEGGLLSRLLTIQDNAFGGPHVVGLYGNAVTGPAVFIPNLTSGNSVAFVGTPVGTTLGPATFMVENLGQSPLVFAGIQTSGDFSQVNNCTTVQPQGSCSLSISFAPTAAGARAGTVTLTDNAADSPQVVQLSGTGEDFGIAATNSASVTRPQSATYTVGVSALGGFSESVSLVCKGAPAESTCTVSPATVTPNGTNTTNVTVVVTTTAPSHAPPRHWFLRLTPNPARILWLLVGWLVLPMLAASTSLRVSRGTRVRLGVASLALLLAVSCGSGGGGGGGGGGNPGTPAGSYSLTVTGTANVGANSLSHSVTLTLNVR